MSTESLSFDFESASTAHRGSGFLKILQSVALVAKSSAKELLDRVLSSRASDLERFQNFVNVDFDANRAFG